MKFGLEECQGKAIGCFILDHLSIYPSIQYIPGLVRVRIYRTREIKTPSRMMRDGVEA